MILVTLLDTVREAIIKINQASTYKKECKWSILYQQLLLLLTPNYHQCFEWNRWLMALYGWCRMRDVLN
jgi:hypothetical protein